jgi:ABC-type sugar transport system permease subunit
MSSTLLSAPRSGGHAEPPDAKPERARRRSPERVLLLPLLAVLGVVYLYPLVEVARLSLRRDSVLSSQWVLFDNYVYLLRDDPTFWQALRHNLFLLLGLPIMVCLAVVVAFAIFDGLRGSRLTPFFRGLCFLPYVLSSVVVGQVFSVFLRSDGPINRVAEQLGMGTDVAWLGDAGTALPSILAVIIWREIGLGVLLFLARLTSVPESYFEVARLEGASYWQTLRYVVVPVLKPTIAFWTLLNMVIMFSWVFNYVYVLTHGGPGTATTVAELEIYNWADRPSAAQHRRGRCR